MKRLNENQRVGFFARVIYSCNTVEQLKACNNFLPLAKTEYELKMILKFIELQVCQIKLNCYKPLFK